MKFGSLIFFFGVVALGNSQFAVGGEAAPLDKISRILKNSYVDPARQSQFTDEEDTSEVYTLEQKISHGDPNSATFQQRYYYNGMYAKDSHSPVLLYTCGEWTCEPKQMMRALGKRAKALGAHIVSMEHRYYGESLPYGKESKSLPALKELQINAALKDFSIIQEKISKDKDLDGQWIATGCSYGGTLAAHYRARYPHLVVGAYASSAPVIATPEGYHQYDEIASKAVSDECRSNTVKATGYLHDLASTQSGLSEIRALFGYETAGVTQSDIDSVLVTIVPQFAQYGSTVALCNSLSSEESPKQMALKLVSLIKSTFGKRFYGESLVGVNEIDSKTNEPYGDRWVYQTCAESTWHYSTALSALFSSFPFVINGGYYRDACRRMYGETIDQVKTQTIAEVQRQFEEKTASRVLFTNGSNDPWSALSYTKDIDKDADLTSLVYQGGSHCTEMFSDPKDEKDSLNQIQAATLKKLKSWLD